MNAEWEQWDVQEKTAQANKRQIEGLEPKADPKEKEYKLEWAYHALASDGGSEVIGANFPFGFYAVTFHFQTKRYTWSMNDFKQYPCTDFDDGKRQAQDHFNSKLKLCLNREL